MGPAVDPNYLVVSDLHLGDFGGPVVGGQVHREVDHALIRFVVWYTEHTLDDRPWRLIIAGDGIDFLHRSLMAGPRPAGPGTSVVGDGPPLEHTEARAVSTLEAIVADNRAVFEALVRFVAAGNDLLLLKGNHDAELHWTGVQDRLRELLVELFVASRPGTVDLAVVQAFERRIGVHRWFYYRPDLLYVEHGNQYDELCAFEDVLYPVDADARIDAPLSHVTLRRFRRLLGRLDAHDLDRWGLRDFLRWILGLDLASVARAGLTYLTCPTWLARLDRKRRQASDEAQAIRHHRLREILDHFRLDHEVVQLLDRLKRSAGRRNLWLGLRMLFYDQLALFGALAALLTCIWLTPLPALARAAVGALAIVGAARLSRHGLRTRRVDPHPKLIEGARSVAALLRVPYVVFGHSHTPEVCALSATGATYVNTGSWTHEGAHGLTYFRLARQGAQHRAELRRWDPHAGRSELLPLAGA